MEISVLDYDKKANRLVVALRNTDTSVVNAIRRIATDEVPVMAVEDVEFRKNSSAIYDEMIAHRLGLVPLKTDLESYSLPDKCKCGGAGCARCQVKMTLAANVQGPCTVYAEELKSKDPKIKPVFGKMPIVSLLKGQKLEIEATAVLGKGREHAKWSPGLVHYKHYPDVKETGEIKDTSLVDRFPKVFELKGKKIGINELELAKSNMTDSIDELTGGAVRVEDREKDFVMFVESWGQLECKEILESAAEIFGEKLESFQEELGKK
ncbi:DNA-directed RNA polymerase subunit D [Candidatus Woesearchaeota archaeon]|nr:DNA-directed RNA polymerase subunit D [Candidatus Woesearchaeota archaeon]